MGPAEVDGWAVAFFNKDAPPIPVCGCFGFVEGLLGFEALDFCSC